MARFSDSNNGDGLTGVKTIAWGYPTNDAVAIQNNIDGESIALKSSDSAAIRWHIRDGGSSVIDYEVDILSINDPGTDGNIVTFDITSQNIPLPTAWYYTVNTITGDNNWSGVYIATASTTNTITLDYITSTDAFDRSNVTADLQIPSVYNQMEVNQNGSWIKNTNWTEPSGYANYWHFTNDGSIHFPYNTSNQRTGSGDVLKFATSIDQAIIAGPSPTSSNPTAPRMVIAGADGYTDSSGEGGDIYLWAGVGGSADGSGGDIKLDGGNGSGTGEGGTVKMRGGYSPNGTGGFINIEAGYGSVAGGHINISSYNTAPITLSGDGGEFLNNPYVPDNQIATIGDISTVVTTDKVRYSPTFAATGLAFTGTDTTYPTYNSYYVKSGKMVSFVIEVDCSTVTNFGTGQYKLQLPFTPAVGFNHFSGWANIDVEVNPDVTNGHIVLNVDHAGVTDILDLHYLKQAGGAHTPVVEGLFLQGTPVILTDSSKIYVNGTYIAA